MATWLGTPLVEGLVMAFDVPSIALGMLIMLWIDHEVFPLLAHRMTLARHRRLGGR